ncbi:hypothetical protein Q5P01_003203 [Channa striata]|uniref:G-protein coupled receptors family 1 profile domain-containing protein n=1 Tax=Channa striata TaxID=64152 RepID=A0AA88T030_CHASR|nr:hypothetical protein Q5P01_003203 [Channa striata]
METTTFYYDYSEISFQPVYPCSREDDNYLGAQLSFLYYFMFVFSVIGNGLVLFIIYRFEKLTTVTNILLLNLVFSSLIFMSSLPFWGIYMQLQTWIFGRVMCKLVGSVYYMGFYSSVLFLTLLTFDRHLAVVYSLGASQVRTRRYAVVSCTGVWLVSALACIRPMILQNTFVSYIENKTYCDEYPANLDFINVDHLQKSGFYLQLFLFLIFPLVVIIYCYFRIAISVLLSKLVTKFKTVRLIFVIVLLFFLCWIPFNIVVLMDMDSEELSCHEMQRRGYALHVTRIIAYIYFWISPIFYTFVGKKFQDYFRQLLVKRFPELKKHISVSQYSQTDVSTRSTPNEL